MRELRYESVSCRYSKLSNMRKGGKLSNDGQNGKDRQMIDM